MLNKKLIMWVVVSLACIAQVDARKPDNAESPSGQPSETQTSLRAVCTRPTAQIEMQVNNVRSRLLTGGDLWSEAQYVVPLPAPGQLPVSALYAGGVWIGGVDEATNIRLSAVTYRSQGFDFFSGPLDLNGATEFEQCKDWDRFFVVNGENVKRHFNNVLRFIETGVEIECDSIADDVLYWPGQGNPYWRERFDFSLPDQSLGAYWDQDGDNTYDPCKGDFPIIDIRGCEPFTILEAGELIPDEMTFWIYNDAGAPHTLSGPNQIQMEVQVQAFAYATNDEINDMTFYRYKLINKAKGDLLDCYFSMWVDPDLGCYQDDYIGCDTTRSLGYVYNQDAVDGSNGTNCEGTPTYGTTIPIVGIDYFRGPLGPKVYRRDSITGELILDSEGNKILLEPRPFTGELDTLVELGMTSFTYHENCGIGSPPPGTCDPQRGREDGFYNLIRGFWQDGTPYTFGASGYNPGSGDTVRYAFPDDPNLLSGWSMCTANLPFGDRRTLQATGPLLLQPGATNELIVGVVFVPDIDYPCPDITRLKFADDIAQALFDNCFDITDGPDAPDITAVELDRELILMFSNEFTSNNFNEEYEEKDLQAPSDVDNLYKFEGYKLYQLANASVTAQELDDIEKARLIAQFDVKNGVTDIYNWTGQVNPLDPIFGPTVWTPERQVAGINQGIRNTVRITEDQFALADRRLVNHKQYHFLVLAYAYNNWKPLDIISGEGQKRAYLEGRGNVGGPDRRPYTLVPRPIVYQNLNAVYGEGAEVTRVSGEGNPGIFLELADGMHEKILSSDFDGRITYKKGAGPITAQVVDPIRAKSGKYRLEVTGTFNTNRADCAYNEDAVWTLYDITDGGRTALLQDRPLSAVKEYLLNNRGVSLLMENYEEPGSLSDDNGAIGAVLEYKDPNGNKWFNAITDGGVIQQGAAAIRVLDFVRNNNSLDPSGDLSTMGDGFFVPFLSTKFDRDPELPFYLSPAARDLMLFMTSSNVNSIRYRDLNNVDIVFTSDKSKWSKCIVVETATADFYNNDIPTIGEARNFEVRQTPSIDQNGNPLNDGTVGFSYFPGYAIDIETGKRLNIFFGENSVFNSEFAENLDDNVGLGGDLIFNPSSQLISETATDIRQLVAGGQHYIYVTRQAYDGCALISERLRKGSSSINKQKAAPAVTWVSFPITTNSNKLNDLELGLIPNDLTVKLRVTNPYGQSRKYNIEKERDCETFGDDPVYEFEFRGVEADDLNTQEEYEGALANVNVVPNPYYAYSAYETSQFTNTIKITNLPAVATVTIYSLDGNFIRQYRRDERGRALSGSNRPTSTTQVFPDLDWDMKNFREVPVASGVYLIHIVAPELGEERTIKWFGIGRKFDPSGL